MQDQSFNPVKFVAIGSVAMLFVMGATDVETYVWLKAVAIAVCQTVTNAWFTL